MHLCCLNSTQCAPSLASVVVQRIGPIMPSVSYTQSSPAFLPRNTMRHCKRAFVYLTVLRWGPLPPSGSYCNTAGSGCGLPNCAPLRRRCGPRGLTACQPSDPDLAGHCANSSKMPRPSSAQLLAAGAQLAQQEFEAPQASRTSKCGQRPRALETPVRKHAERWSPKGSCPLPHLHCAETKGNGMRKRPQK